MIPKFLTEKDIIKIVAPSFGCTTSPYKERLNVAITNLSNLGYKIELGENVYKNIGVAASNTPIIRAKEIIDAFKSNATAIMSAGGGELMIEILEYINFDIIKNNPKWFVGFSDNTNLTYTITTICDLETIYGVNAPSFYSIEYDSFDTLRMLKGEKEFKSYGKWQYNKKNDEPLSKYEFDMKTKIIPINYTSSFKGRLIGGCIDCLSLLCGTKFDNTKEYIENHKEEGIIFFLEACDLNSISLRRSLLQLKYAGWFTNIKGFIIGRSNNYYDESFGQSMLDSYKDILSPFNVPLLLDIDLGHLCPSMPIRCGAMTEISYKCNKITIKYE